MGNNKEELEKLNKEIEVFVKQEAAALEVISICRESNNHYVEDMTVKILTDIVNQKELLLNRIKEIEG